MRVTPAVPPILDRHEGDPLRGSAADRATPDRATPACATPDRAALGRFIGAPFGRI